MIVVNVSQDDIDKAERGQWSLCPIAKSLKRKQKKKISVFSGVGIKIYKTSKTFLVYRGITKREEDRIDKFINSFDKCRKVKPVQFKIKKAKSYNRQ